MNKHRMHLDRLFTTTKTKGNDSHYHILEIDDAGNIFMIDISSGPSHTHRINGDIIEKDATHTHELSQHTKDFIKSLKDKRKKS